MSSLSGPTIWEISLRPLVVSMTMCGMNLNTRKGVNNWSRCIFTTGSSLMLATYCLTCNIQTLRHLVSPLQGSTGHRHAASSATPLLVVLSNIFRVLCSLCVIIFFALRRHRISAIFWKLHRCLHIVPGANIRTHIWRIKIQVAATCVLCWGAILFFVYVNIWRNAEEPIGNSYGYRSASDYANDLQNFKGLYWWKLVLAHVFDVALLIATTMGPMSFFGLSFILFCSSLAIVIDDFNAWMNEANKEASKSVVRLKTFRSIRKALIRLLEEADDAVSPITFFVIAILLTDIFKYAYFLASKRDFLNLVSLAYVVPIIARMLYVTLMFIFITLSAVIVADKLQETLPVLNRFAKSVEQDGGRNGDYVQNCSASSTNLESETYLTLWSLFPINRRFLMGVLISVFACVLVTIVAFPQVIKIHSADLLKDKHFSEL